MPFQSNSFPTAAQSPGDIAKAFLERLDPAGMHHLVAFDPQSDGPSHGKTFAPGALDDVVGWVNERAGLFNLYHTVNEVRADFVGIKAKKGDVVSVRAVWVDIVPPGGADLDVARADISSRVSKAPNLCKSIIVDSGGGFHAYSLLASKVAATPENVQWAEAQGLGMAEGLRGDHVQNVDRILRLPGPDNIPTAAKASRGRVQRPARVVKETGERFTRAQLEAAVAPSYTAQTTDKSPQIAAIVEDLRRCGYDREAIFEDLSAELQTKFNSVLADRRDLARL